VRLFGPRLLLAPALGAACTRAVDLDAALPPCGDGVRQVAEQGDDGDRRAGDGCNAACRTELGFTCTEDRSGRSRCAPRCGDGILVEAPTLGPGSGEAWDDANLKAGDGCSPGCEVEPGWGCDTDTPSECNPTCGRGGDGCDRSCQVEMGSTCDMASPTACAPICGDGVRLGTEGRDDDNLEPEDGCSSVCEVEAGWTSAAWTGSALLVVRGPQGALYRPPPGP
jgi:cysteine-rich repeat protein